MQNALLILQGTKKVKVNNYLKEKFSNYSNGYDIFIMSISIYLLFGLSVLFVYKFPIGLDKLFFALLFFIFWFSKHDYFWFAFFIIISSFPGGFFIDTAGDAVRRLPIFTILPKVSFSVFDVFMILSLLKAIFKGRRLKIKDVLNIKYGSLFIIYLFVITAFYGVSLKTFISLPLRGLFFYTFFYSFPSLVYKKNDAYKFMYLFFPFVFNELFTQVFLLSTGKNLVNEFYSGASSFVVIDKLMGENIRAIANGHSIVVLSFIFALALMCDSDNYSSKGYLSVIIIVAFLSVIFSATRQSIIMLGFMFTLYLIFVNKVKPGLVIQLFFAGLVLFFIIDVLDVFNIGKIITASFDRLTGAVNLSKGSIEAEDTLDYRLTVRLPIILENIKGSLFLGYGLSDKFFLFNDGHLGGILLGILQMGVIGYSILLMYVVMIYSKSISFIKRFGESNSTSGIIKSLLIGMSGYFLLNLFINPTIVFNVRAQPQEFFILIVLVSQFIKYGRIEHYYKNRLAVQSKVRI